MSLTYRPLNPQPIEGGNSTPVVISGAVTSTPDTSATGTTTSVASLATNVQLLPTNAARKGFTVYNDSTSVLYLKLGTTATITSFTVPIGAGGFYENPKPVYTGEVDGIWASANGSARITELS